MANEDKTVTPKLSDSEDDLHNWGMALVEDGTGRRRAWEGVWWENIATYVGDLWVEFDVVNNRLTEPVPRPAHKARLPVNLAQPVVRTEIAKLTKNRPILDPQPEGDERKQRNAAEIADKILNNFVETEFHMPRKRRRMLNWACICGLGGLYVDWDDNAQSAIEVFMDPRGNPIMTEEKRTAYKKYYKRRDEQMKTMRIPQGEMVQTVLSPFQLIWDFSKLEFEDAWWCIVSDIYDCDQVERRWGMRPDPESDAKPGVIERRLLGRMDLTNTLEFETPTGQDLCTIHRLYVKPGHPYFPDGAHLVFTNDEMVKKENHPMRHGELPVSLMGHVPLPTSQFSMSVLQQVRPIVVEISKTESQLIDNRNLMSNPPWREARQTKVQTEIQNKPGLRIKYTHVPNVPPPEPVQMPEMPAYVQGLVEVLKEHVLEISGQGETSQGRVPPGARSGVAIAYLQEEDDTRLGPTVSEFEECLEFWGYLTLETIAEKYEIPRTIRVSNSKAMAPDVFDFVGAMIDGTTQVKCQAGSGLPRSKAAKQQFILDLWDRQLEQDPRKVREMLELSAGEPDEWTIDLDQADRENRKLQRGEPVFAEEWHNHPAHLYQHHNFMKGADFDALPEDGKQLWREHCDEHDAFQKQQDVELSGMQQGPGQGSASAENGQMSAANPQNGQPVPGGPPPQFSPESLLNQQPQ